MGQERIVARVVQLGRARLDAQLCETRWNRVLEAGSAHGEDSGGVGLGTLRRIRCHAQLVSFEDGCGVDEVFAIRRIKAQTTDLRQKEWDVESVYVVPDAGGGAFHRIEHANGTVARRYSASSDIVGGFAVDPRGFFGNFDVLIDQPAGSIDHRTF